MTEQQLSQLSLRFQSVYRVFSPTLQQQLTLAQCQSMDSSPVMLGLLEQQLAYGQNASTNDGTGTIQLGVDGGGTSNNIGRTNIITVDPSFLKYAVANETPGYISLVLAHEIGHTVDDCPKLTHLQQ